MIPTRLTGRTAFRLATAFVVIFSVTMLAIFATLYFVISRDLISTLQDEINDLKDTLVSVGSTSGRNALAAMVTRRTASQADDNFIVLTDLEGNYIAGNILPIPRFNSWRRIDLTALPFVSFRTVASNSTAVLGTWTEVPEGYLFVSSGNGDVEDVQTILIGGFGWAVMLTAISSILGGIILGLSAQRRVDAIERALDAFSHGNLDDRVRRRLSRDDLDHVAELINATLDRLQRLIGSLKQVTTDIAHDLKTPISRMRQKLEVTLSESHDASVYRTSIESTLVDIDQIVETFEALLRIAEIGAGSRRARFTDVSLKSVLTAVIEALLPVAEERGQTLIADVSQMPDDAIRGDRQLLNQLFVNLVDNAIRHCPVGATITARIERENAHIRAVIRDNGPGIPIEEHKNVLRPLYRLEKSRTTPGSGLGLSLVAAIVELHAGDLELSDARPGLEIRIRFPRRV